MEVNWELLKCKRYRLTTMLRGLELPKLLLTLMRLLFGGQLSWFSKESSTKAWFILVHFVSEAAQI